MQLMLDRRRLTVLFVAVICLLAGLVSTSCEAECEICNIDNYCTRCKKGYFVQPHSPGATDGRCIGCGIGCDYCIDQEICTTCKPGHTEEATVCELCSKGCESCFKQPSNCTTCLKHYVHDKHNFCYFKYIPHIIAGSVVGLFLLVVIVKLICLWLDRRRNRKTFFPDSVLDSESRVNTYFVQDPKLIGLIDSGDKDLSRVAGQQDADKRSFMNENTAYDVLGMKSNDRDTASQTQHLPNNTSNEKNSPRRPNTTY